MAPLPYSCVVGCLLPHSLLANPCQATDAYTILNEVKEASLTSGVLCAQPRAWGHGAVPGDSAGEIAICSSSQTALLGHGDCQED